MSKKEGFRFTLIVSEKDLTLPWSHIRAKLNKTFSAEVDGLWTKIQDVNLRDGDREYEKECHS